MGDHRTLDEFAREQPEDDPEATDEAIVPEDERAETIAEEADSETEIEDGETPDSASPNPNTASPSPDTAAVEPPATTYRWTPEGVACGDCGAVAERQWRDDGVFVCADCKDW